MPAPEKNKSLESWIWDAACSIRGAKDAPKYKDYILPLIFTKSLCDVFDDELNRIAKEVGSRKSRSDSGDSATGGSGRRKAFQLAKADPKLVRFYLPLVPDDPEQPVWSVIRRLSDKIGEGVTSHMRAIARENPLLQGIIDRVDFNATTHGQRDLDDDRLPGAGHDLSRIKAPVSAAEELPKSVVEELNERQKAILELAVSTGSVTNRQVQQRFKVVRDTAHRDLSMLSELNFLRQEGKGRATRYLPKNP